MKQLLLLITLFCCVTFLQAQENQSYWGIKVGLNVSEIRSKDQPTIDLSTTTGLHAEVFRNFQINDLFALQAGIAYTERGGKDRIESISTIDFDEKFDINTTYVSLPIVFQTRRGNFLSELGVVPALQLGVNADVSDPTISKGGLESVWESDFDFGLIAGVGYHIKDLEIGVRVIPGLARVSSEITFTDQDGNPTSTERYGRNLVVQMTAAYRIN
ncbi:MAG: porin family protein [Bacteroidota bacterium]